MRLEDEMTRGMERTYDCELFVDRDERRVLDPRADHAEEEVKCVERDRRVDVRRRIDRMVADHHKERHNCQNTITPQSAHSKTVPP